MAAELRLVPPPHYKLKLTPELKAAAVKEAQDAISSIEGGTLAMADLSLERAIELVRFAQKISSIREE